MTGRAERATTPSPGEVEAFLEAVSRVHGTPEEISRDPVRFPRRFVTDQDREVAGLIASALAFGRVAAFLPVLEMVFSRLGPSPASRLAGLHRADSLAIARGIGYRWVRGHHLAALLLGAGRLLSGEGSLRGPVLRAWREGRGVSAGLVDLSVRIRALADDLDPGFLVPESGRESPMKRMHLFLRWMVRTEFPDLGVWREIPPGDLVVPLDVHVHRLAVALGLLPARRGGPRLADAWELTQRLRALWPEDPLCFDFAWSHLGISGGCRGRRGPACDSCGIRDLCRLRLG